MEPLIIGLVSAAVLAAAGVAVHVALTWADRRRWVYYRNPDRPPPRSLGLLEQIYQPSVTHVVDREVEEATRADQAESGDPEKAGRSDRNRRPLGPVSGP